MTFVIFILALLVMFIPTFVAFKRNLKRRYACLVVNILFGWTILLWIPILIWSLLTSAVE